MGQDPIANPKPLPDSAPPPSSPARHLMDEARAAGLDLRWPQEEVSDAPYRESEAEEAIVITLPPPEDATLTLVWTAISAVLAAGAAVGLLIQQQDFSPVFEYGWPLALLAALCALGSGMSLHKGLLDGLFPLLYRSRVFVSRFEISVFERAHGREPWTVAPKEVKSLFIDHHHPGDDESQDELHDLVALLDDGRERQVLGEQKNLPRLQVLKKIIEQQLGL